MTTERYLSKKMENIYLNRIRFCPKMSYYQTEILFIVKKNIFIRNLLKKNTIFA